MNERVEDADFHQNGTIGVAIIGLGQVEFYLNNFCVRVSMIFALPLLSFD